MSDGFMIFFFLACGAMAVVGGFSIFYSTFWDSTGAAVPCAFFFPFPTAGIIYHIGQRTVPGGTFDVGKNGTMPGYTWSDLYDWRTSPDQEFIFWKPNLAPIHFIAILIGDIVLGLWFAWYFDIVWPGDRGVPESFFFFFKPSVRPLTPTAVLALSHPACIRSSGVSLQLLRAFDFGCVSGLCLLMPLCSEWLPRTPLIPTELTTSSLIWTLT